MLILLGSQKRFNVATVFLIPFGLLSFHKIIGFSVRLKLHTA